MRVTKTYTKAIIVMHSISLLIVIFASFAFIRISNKTIPYISGKNSLIGVSGFTNLNSWRMETKSINFDANFVISNGNLKSINSLKFTTPVKSLISTHPNMDTVVYNMLDKSGKGVIKFSQTKAMVLPRMKMVNIIGNLSIGGVTKIIDLQLSYDVKNEKEIYFKGLKKLDLHDFGITRSNPILKRVKFDDQVMIQIEMNSKTGI